MPISPRAIARAMVEAAMEMKEVKEPLYWPMIQSYIHIAFTFIIPVFSWDEPRYCKIFIKSKTRLEYTKDKKVVEHSEVFSSKCEKKLIDLCSLIQQILSSMNEENFCFLICKSLQNQ